LYESFRHGPRIIPVAGIESGLAAAGLLGGKIQIVAYAAKDPNQVEADLGNHLVNETRNEKGDAGHILRL
jgi:hypothetical protein